MSSRTIISDQHKNPLQKTKAIPAGKKSNQWIVYAHLGLDLISTKKKKCSGKVEENR
jgi:hypothetical protein